MALRGFRGSLEFDAKKLGVNLSQLDDRVDTYVHATMEYQSGKVLNHAKVNAPWTDRTGNARNGLSTEVDWVPKKEHAIRLFHRVTYGIWLEVRFAGRYAIIAPTIKKYGPETMRLFNRLFAKLRTQGLVP